MDLFHLFLKYKKKEKKKFESLARSVYSEWIHNEI